MGARAFGAACWPRARYRAAALEWAKVNMLMRPSDTLSKRAGPTRGLSHYRYHAASNPPARSARRLEPSPKPETRNRLTQLASPNHSHAI